MARFCIERETDADNACRHEDMKDLQCMSFTSKGTGEIIVAGMGDQMFVIDVHRGEITKKVRHSCKGPRAGTNRL